MKYANVYEVWDNIYETSSTNEKLDILRANKDSDTLAKWLYYTYNPYFNYGIFNVPDEAWELCQELPEIAPTELFFETLDKLRNREATGNKAKELIIEFAKQVNTQTLECFQATLHHTLDAGVSVTSINKVWGNLIPTFSIAKANPLSDESQLQNYPVQVEQKMNGVRVVIICEPDNIEIFSSNGNAVPQTMLPNLRKQIRQISNLSECNSFVLDGELTSSNRKSVSGIFNKALKDTLTDKEELDANLYYTAFDILPVEVWQTNSESKPLSTRIFQLRTLLTTHTTFNTNIGIVPSITAYNYSQIKEFYDSVIENGGEGAIIKSLNSPYSFCRNDSWLKIKNISEADLKIIGFTRGTGKRDGLIGAITVETSDKKLRVNVGSGLSDENLKHFTNYQSELLGRIITVQYNELIKDKDGNLSLFLPRFIELRNDKTEADTLEKLVAESNGSEM